MKGDRFPSEHATFLDSATGARIHQLTAHPSINHPTYFLQSSFTPDGCALIFTSYRTGSAQLFEIAPYPDGEIRQLTDGAGDPSVFTRHSSRRPHASFSFAAAKFGTIDRVTLDERSVIDFRGRATGRMLARRRRVSGSQRPSSRASQQGLVAGRADGSDWRLIPFPRTVIHPQFHPLEPEWIEFSGDPAPRMHRVRRDGSGLECLYQHGNDEFVVHETFLGRTGNLVFTVWPRALRQHGLDHARNPHHRRVQRLAHHAQPRRNGRFCATPTIRTLVCTSIDVATGARRLICLSEASSQGTQWRKSRYALAEDFAAAAGSAPGVLSVGWRCPPTPSTARNGRTRTRRSHRMRSWWRSRATARVIRRCTWWRFPRPITRTPSSSSARPAAALS